MTNIIQYSAQAQAQARQARDLQTPELRLAEDGSAIELTLHDNAGYVVAILEYRLHEKQPEGFDLGRLRALWNLLRDGSATAS
jgi:hypothetical protein